MPNKLQQEQSDCVTAEEGRSGGRARPPFSGLTEISELFRRSGDFNFRPQGKKDEDVVQVSLSFSLLRGEVTDKSDSLEKEVLSVIAAECFSLIAIQYRST